MTSLKDENGRSMESGEGQPHNENEPGLTPGSPHPDQALAAQGWRVCNHGIYTRHPDGQLEPEREAC
jgi:hypothetical protein